MKRHLRRYVAEQQRQGLLRGLVGSWVSGQVAVQHNVPLRSLQDCGMGLMEVDVAKLKVARDVSVN